LRDVRARTHARRLQLYRKVIVLPQLEKIGVATAAEVNIDTLEDRLRDAASIVHSQVLGPMQVCGWTKL
jgi:hypothetical protein